MLNLMGETLRIAFSIVVRFDCRVEFLEVIAAILHACWAKIISLFAELKIVN